MPDPLPHLIRLVWWTCTGPPGPAWGTHTNTQLWCTVPQNVCKATFRL